MVSERPAGLGHLHQAEHPFVHARSAAGGNDDQRQSFFRRGFNQAGEFLTDDRAHGTAKEIEIHHPEGRAMAVDLADSRDDGVLKLGLLLILLQFVRVGGHAGEPEHVHTGHLRVHLLE